MYAWHVYPGPAETRKGGRRPELELQEAVSSHAVQELWVEPGSPGRVVSALSHLAIPPASYLQFGTRSTYGFLLKILFMLGSFGARL